MTSGYWDRPSGFWSFWEMITVLGIWFSVRGQIDGMKQLVGRFRPDQELPEDDKLALAAFLVPWQMHCHEAGFMTALRPIEHVIGPYDENRLRQPQERMRIRFGITAGQALRRIEQFEENLTHDAGMRVCVAIDPDKLGFYNGNEFIPDIKTAFPSAMTDIEEAGKCYALRLHRATIFHAIRATEWGLKALARAAGVRGQLDYKEWGKIIKQVEDKVAGIDKWHNGPAKTNALDFYRGSLSDIRALNNCWRTANLHVRPGITCDVHDAKKALDRAIDVLVRLSKRITENQKRPASKRSFKD